MWSCSDWAKRWTAWGFISARVETFFLIQNVCTRPGPTQLQCKEGAFSVVVKQLLCEVHHSRLCGAEGKNEWSYVSTPVFFFFS